MRLWVTEDFPFKSYLQSRVLHELDKDNNFDLIATLINIARTIQNNEQCMKNHTTYDFSMNNEQSRYYYD